MSEHERPSEPGYERADASVRPVLLFTLGLSLVVTVVIFLMIGLFNFFDRAETAEQRHALATTIEPPAPRLQTSTGDDLAAYREREAALVNEYAWIDRQAGIVRIPVERAMELTAQRGLPVRK